MRLNVGNVFLLVIRYWPKLINILKDFTSFIIFYFHWNHISMPIHIFVSNAFDATANSIRRLTHFYLSMFAIFTHSTLTSFLLFWNAVVSGNAASYTRLRKLATDELLSETCLKFMKKGKIKIWRVWSKEADMQQAVKEWRELFIKKLTGIFLKALTILYFCC